MFYGELTFFIFIWMGSFSYSYIILYMDTLNTYLINLMD